MPAHDLPQIWFPARRSLIFARRLSHLLLGDEPSDEVQGPGLARGLDLAHGLQGPKERPGGLGGHGARKQLRSRFGVGAEGLANLGQRLGRQLLQGG